MARNRRLFASLLSGTAAGCCPFTRRLPSTQCATPAPSPRQTYCTLRDDWSDVASEGEFWERMERAGYLWLYDERGQRLQRQQLVAWLPQDVTGQGLSCGGGRKTLWACSSLPMSTCAAWAGTAHCCNSPLAVRPLRPYETFTRAHRHLHGSSPPTPQACGMTFSAAWLPLCATRAGMKRAGPPFRSSGGPTFCARGCR